MERFYWQRPVVVTGGLGFIGSNLTLRLVELGARVTVIDGSIPGCGANPYNLSPASERVKVIHAGLAEDGAYAAALANASVVFNLAGEISHIQSMRDPLRDLQLNTFAQLRFLTTLGRVNPGARVVYAGTRQVCGKPRYLPVDEDHPIDPVDFNGIHKRAAEHYHLLMSRDGLVDAVVLRLTNVYGPRLAIGVSGQGFLSAFLLRALQGQTLEVFGDGSQLRDPVYVDDAIEAFLLAGMQPRWPSRLYHLGGPAPLSLLEIARVISREAGLMCDIRLRPFPEEHLVFDIGSYTTDSTRLQAVIDWRPRTSFEEGIRCTLAYFRAHLAHYLPAPLQDTVPAA
ncbi:MAG: NAD-dependent epimerase/dehydratase family protein [Bryobacteraceae bacterium]|nr:NAD-dependent epimerase/dehydratase family protein [Bryobacteraceae bacterium]